MLIRHVRSQLHISFRICSYLESGNEKEIIKEFPYMKGKILERNIFLARHFGTSRFEKALVIIDEIDLLLKNSQAPFETVVDILCLKLTQ